MALGEEKNTGDINFPGTYRDPLSGAELTVTMEAGADALARLGWVRIEDVKPEHLIDPYAEAEKQEKAEAAKAAKAAKAKEKELEDAKV